MALNPQERRKLKSLLKKADLDFHCPHCSASTPIDDHLIESSPALKKHEHGAPEKGADEVLLEGLERCVRVLMQTLELERGPAMLWFARSLYQVPLTDSKGRKIAISPEALAKRWEQKLRKGGFDTRPFETLRPQGVLLPLLKSRTMSLPYQLPDDFFSL